MVLIFGWGAGKAEDFGEVAPTTCPICHNEVFLHHVKSDKSFSLYFIPLASYGSDEYLVCPICHNGLQVDPAKRPAVGRMRAATRAFRNRTMTLEAYQPTVDLFWRELGVDTSGAQVLHGASTVPAPADPAQAAAVALARRLEGLGKLHAEGVLTDEEFAAAKRRLLET
jgi:uncharacterized protein YbaR (Trm112 family)